MLLPVDREERATMEWLDQLATTLDVPPLNDAQADALLMVSREVAHGVERRVTPLAAFLIGRAVQASGDDPEGFAHALGMVRAALPGDVEDG
jgi:hypothetical protein